MALFKSLLTNIYKLVIKIRVDCLVAFCDGVMELYGKEHLLRPTQTDVEKLYDFHEEKHEFPRMIGSIDCTKSP